MLLARATVSFFLSSHGQSGYWEVAKDRNLELAEQWESEAPGNENSRKLREFTSDFEQRAKTWVKVAESWQQLCSSPLSDEALEAWIEEIMLKKKI